MSAKNKKKKSKITKKKKQAKNGDSLFDWIKTIAIALALAFIAKTSIVEAYWIPSGSMEDTLLIDDYLVGNKFLYGARLPLLDVQLPAIRDPEPGDVVVFKYPGDSTTNYIKRCIAVGGQTVEIKNKVVYVDGVVFDNPEHAKYTDADRILPSTVTRRDNFGPYTVPQDHFFMMGDNRDNSYDSRFWGPVPRKMILAKAIIILGSWGDDPNAPNWEWSDPLSVGKAVFYNAAHFFSRVRWGRLGTLIV